MGEVFLVDVALLLLVVGVGIAAIRTRSLLASTMLLGIYSLLMALVWANMFAMDVAFTEAAVGAGVSTILLLGAMVIVGREEKPKRGAPIPALLAVLACGAALIYGTLDMPRFGDPDAPIHRRTAPEYIAQAVGHAHTASAESAGAHDSDHGAEPRGGDHLETGHDDGEHAGDFGHHVPNLVTAILADYRGYDTMFETSVIFTAGVCLILLLRSQPTRTREEESA